MNSPPVTSLNQMLLQVVSGVVPSAGSGSTPNQLATIAAGSLITGNVFGRDAQGNTQLETPDGMISLKMDLFLKRGIEVVLRMEQVHKEMFARIVSVDGKSLAKYMESMGLQAPQQDSILHSSPLLQTTPDKAAPVPTTPGSPTNQTVPPAENAATLKAILLTPPFLDESAPLPTAPLPTAALSASQPTQAAWPAEMDSLPPEIKLILLKAAVGTILKIDIQKLELPQSILPTLTAGTPTLAQPTAPATPQAIQIPGTLQPLPHQPTAPNMSVPLAVNAGTTVPNPTALPGAAAPSPLTPSIVSVLSPTPASVSAPGMTPPSPMPAIPTSVPMQIAPAGVAQILNQVQPTVEPLLPPSPVQPSVLQETNSRPVTPPSVTTTAPNVTSLLQETKPSQATPQQTSPTTPAYRPFTPAGTPTPATVHAYAQPAPIAAAYTPVTSATTNTAPITLQNSPVFSATVIASTPDGQVTLQTPIGVLNLISPTPLPPGTRLSFTLQTIEPPVEETMAPPSGAPISGKSYKGIGDITNLPFPIPYQALGMEAPKLLPRPGPAMASEILFLLAALKGGDVRKWIGEHNASELEKAGKGDLLQRISQDFSALRGSFADSPSQGSWIQGIIPLFYQGLHSLQWFQKQGGQQQGKEKSKSSFDEHFLVDFHLTQLGHMQLDGMVKRTHPGYSFDLTVRSEATLTPSMQRDIASIYSEAQQIGGFKGGLVFRAGLDACVKLETFYAGEAPNQLPHSILA